jgi:DNA-binding Xre family transcriptional regulator
MPSKRWPYAHLPTDEQLAIDLEGLQLFRDRRACLGAQINLQSMVMTTSRELVVNGDAIRRFRERKGMNTTELAAAAGLTEPYLRELESGRQKNSSLLKMGGISLALGVPIGKLVKWETPDG